MSELRHIYILLCMSNSAIYYLLFCSCDEGGTQSQHNLDEKGFALVHSSRSDEVHCGGVGSQEVEGEQNWSQVMEPQSSARHGGPHL